MQDKFKSGGTVRQVKCSLNMRLMIVFTFIAVTVFTFSHAFQFFPENSEVVYEWTAEIKAGTHLPVEYASRFALEGEIRFQNNNGTIFGSISNLTYTVYSGIFDQNRENIAEEVSLSEEVQDLGNIFEIVYNDKGLVERIITESEEKEFSRNIKRAIAATFQIESSILRRKFNRPETFSVRENSVHDWVDIEYSIYPKTGGLEVLKIHDISGYKYANLVTNGEFEHCDAESTELGTHENRKKYIFVEENDGFVARNISTGSTVTYSLFNDVDSDAQYVEIRQSFKLRDVVEVEEEYQLESEGLSTGLRYVEDSVDSTNGRRRTIDYSEVIPVVQKLLEQISDYLEEIKITAQNPDPKNSQLVNRVHTLLKQFCSEGFQQLLDNLEPNVKKIFYHILPLLDTDASKLLIKDLVVNKTVYDTTSVKLVQNMGNVAGPLLPELEELINLDNSYSWELRKVAILRFGTLIHKSYIHSKSEKEYQKYIEEYIRRLRDTNDRKVQQVYIFGLRNMKLPSVLKYLEPGFNGEWWQDQQLRYLSLWAAASSGADNLVEVLWPILTNCEEATEMRILAYIYIMRSRPSLSRLMTLSNYMLTELDEEVYHFHYSYLEAVSQSKEPCLEEQRLRIIDVLKTTPPAKSGLSAATYFGYRDSSFGFSTQFENYFTRTNQSRTYNLLLKTQQGRRFQEEYSIYFKIQDNEDVHLSLTNTFADSFWTRIDLAIARKKSNYLEGAIFKRGQVIDAFYFDRSSMHELFSLLQIFDDKKVTELEMLYFSYFQYHKLSVPTELGLPVQFEFLMPLVHRNTFKLAVTEEKLVLKLFMDAKLVTSVHYRHGLSFYNPLANTWQGVNRYQSFDTVLPMRFAITYTLLSETVNLTCGTSGYVGGLRSFVKQVVFIRSDFDQEEAQVVTLGENYQHNYTLIDEDDSNTGLNFHVGVYNSTRRVSSGTFQTLFQSFAKRGTKQYNSPLDYLVSKISNLLRYSILLPRPGPYGIVAKLESSRKFPVTSVELSLQYRNIDWGKNLEYSPWIALEVILAYSVRNQDRNLKIWRADSKLEINSGHKSGSATIEMTRTIPGQNDYKIYLNITREFSKDILEGNLNISMGEPGKESSIIEVTESGRQSQDQIEGNHLYGTCQYVLPYSWSYYYTQQCLVSYTTIRHYTYDIKTQNLTSDVKEGAESLFDYFKGYFRSYYTCQDNTDSDGLSINLTFPVESSNELDVQVTSPGKVYQFSGIPITFGKWIGLLPESAVYPKIFQLYENLGDNDRFVIYSDRQYSNGQLVPRPVSTAWTLIENKGKFGEIFAKHLGNEQLAVKVSSYNNTLEISPSKVYINDEESTVEDLYEEWLYYRILKSGNVLAFLPKSGVQIVYYSDRVELIVSNSQF